MLQACISFFEVFQDAWRSKKENPNACWNATLSSPSWAQIMRIRISFWSRSDLVLDADHDLDFLAYLVYRRVSRFVAFQRKVAHLCLCLVRIKNLLGIRRRKKIFSPPCPKIPRKHPPSPLPPPAPTRLGDPPSWDFQQKFVRPPSRRLGLPFRYPEQKKKSETSTKKMPPLICDRTVW